MCIKIALDKKSNFITKVCINEDGSSAVKCILMAALFSVLAYIISPVVIYVAWAIIALVFLILSAVAISAVPEGGNGGIDWTWYNLKHIQKHCKLFYNKMLNEHTLYDYLLQLNRDAEDTFNRLVKQMAIQEGVTEQLKADKQMEWVGRMNNIRQRATEIVNNELIYT